MKKMKCANGKTYDVCNETVCFPSGSANVRNVMELWMPESAMTFDEFEALCKDGQAMGKVYLMDASGAEIAAFEHYDMPAEIAKKRFETYDPLTGQTAGEMRLFARMEQLTYTERKLAELGLM